MPLIHIENKISVAEIVKTLQVEKVGAIMECLTIIKSKYADYQDFRNDPAVQQISKIYCINLSHIN